MKRYYVYITITFLLLSACSATVHAVEPEADAGIILTDDSEPDDALENDSNEYRISALSDLPEITVVYGADLFLQGRTLECGDEEGLTDLLDTLSLNFQSIGGLTDDEDEAELVLDDVLLESGIGEEFGKGDYHHNGGNGPEGIRSQKACQHHRRHEADESRNYLGSAGPLGC